MKMCEWCGGEYLPRSRPEVARFCSNGCRLAGLNALPRRRAAGFFSRQVTAKGYVRGVVWDGDERRVLMEHRYVMEQALGRRLTAGEVVHHRNGDRQDNRVENLELVDGHGQHIRHAHVAGRARTVAERQAEIVRLRATGLRQVEIARTLKVSEATVSNLLKPLGLRARGPNHRARPSM